MSRQDILLVQMVYHGGMLESLLMHTNLTVRKRLLLRDFQLETQNTMGGEPALIREIFRHLKNLKTLFAVLNHFYRKCFLIFVLLFIVSFFTNCKGGDNNTCCLSRFDDLEIHVSSPFLSKYSYIFLCQGNECDTIQIYKAESNQILLFSRIKSLDTLFVCDRWNNASIHSQHIPIIKVVFNDSNYFFCPKKSINRLRPEFIQICTPEIKDIQTCHYNRTN